MLLYTNTHIKVLVTSDDTCGLWIKNLMKTIPGWGQEAVVYEIGSIECVWVIKPEWQCQTYK